MQPHTFKGIYKALSMIYFAIVLALVAFIGVSYYLVAYLAIDPDAPELAELFKYGTYVLTPVGMVAGYFLYKKRMSLVEAEASLGSKLSQLQAAVLIRSACLEAPGLLAAMGTMRTGQLELLAFAGALAAIMIFWRPTPESIRNDLQLSAAEVEKLADPEAIIE